MNQAPILSGVGVRRGDTQDEEGSRQLWPVLRQQHKCILGGCGSVLVAVEGAPQEFGLLLVLCAPKQALQRKATW